jgi:cytochrome c oxidase subunit IV
MEKAIEPHGHGLIGDAGYGDVAREHVANVQHLAVAGLQQTTQEITEHTGSQQHPVAIYLWIWVLLFVFSTFSYLIDYFHLHGMLRWSLIILFMLLKASFIVAVFMHMAWERLALKFAILVPPLCLLILIGLMAIEGDYTFLTRLGSFLH